MRVQENPGAQVLATVLTDPGRPRITWYGADGERVELSGAVLANWVAKTANLLVDELDAGPGTRVRLDLPAHWRTVVWTLATWYVGATVSLDATATDLLVTDDATSWIEGADLTVPAVAVALPALARRSAIALPEDVLDYAATVLGHPDAPPPPGRVSGTDPALLEPAGVTTVAAVLADPAEHGRQLVTADRLSTTLLRHLRAVLAGNGSIVLVAADAVDAPGLARLAAAERVEAGADRTVPPTP